MLKQKMHKLYTCDWPWTNLELGKKYEFEVSTLNQTAIKASDEFSELRFVDFYDKFEIEISKLETKKFDGITYGLINCYTVLISYDELFGIIKNQWDNINLLVISNKKIWTILESDRIPSEEELKKVLKYRKRKS